MQQTCNLSHFHAENEDSEEPLERILVHWVDVGQRSHAEEQDSGADGNRNVLTPSGIDVLFGLLSHRNLHLTISKDDIHRFHIWAINSPITMTKKLKYQNSADVRKP